MHNYDTDCCHKVTPCVASVSRGTTRQGLYGAHTVAVYYAVSCTYGCTKASSGCDGNIIDSREQGLATQSAPPVPRVQEYVLLPVLMYYFILCLPVVHPG